MTDQPPTNPGNVIIVGQRRQPDGSFPSLEVGGKGDDDGTTPDMRDEPVPLEPDSGSNPCADPATALPWNADAAGAGSSGPFLSKAAATGDINPQTGLASLSHREFGRGLARGPDGSVWANAVSQGLDPDPSDPDPTKKMTLNFDGIGLDTYIGDAHTHPNGNPLPSQEDWDFFVANNPPRPTQIGAEVNPYATPCP